MILTGIFNSSFLRLIFLKRHIIAWSSIPLKNRLITFVRCLVSARSIWDHKLNLNSFIQEYLVIISKRYYVSDLSYTLYSFLNELLDSTFFRYNKISSVLHSPGIDKPCWILHSPGKDKPCWILHSAGIDKPCWILHSPGIDKPCWILHSPDIDKHYWILHSPGKDKPCWVLHSPGIDQPCWILHFPGIDQTCWILHSSGIDTSL